MRLTEVFHAYDDPENQLDFKPLKRGDTIRVFHGFRDLPDAIRTARIGLSGKDRAERVYSYEYDNNPYGLFVTTNLDIAKRFSQRCIMEFIAHYNELEAPVWPGGGFTVQGQMSKSWPNGRAGIVARKNKQKQLATEPPIQGVPEIHGSDDNYLARTLLASGERQALFIGHLNPDRIVAFYVPTDNHYKTPWTKLDRAAFLERYTDEKLKYSREKGDSRVYQPDDVFDGTTFLRLMKKDAEEVMPDIAEMIFERPVNKRRQEFMNTLAPYLWPKQYADAYRWLYRTYHKSAIR